MSSVCLTTLAQLTMLGALFLYQLTHPMPNTNYNLNKNMSVSTLSIEGHPALCIDDFLENPAELVNFASVAKFAPYPGMLERKGYPGIRAVAPDEYSYNLTTFIEPLIKQHFSVPTALDIRKSMCAISLLTTARHLLSPLQRTPHFDSSTPFHIAALLYLCDESHGGTAFYKHKATEIVRLTPDNVDHYLDTYYRELNEGIKTSANLKDAFSQVGYIEAKPNRLVLYHGSLIHDAIINPDKSISANPREGRLTVNTFFDF